jgi:hypothetical protein
MVAWMRSPNEIREYFRDTLNNSLSRLSMYGGDGFGCELFARSCLQYLTFIDQREDEYRDLLAELIDRKASDSGGVRGAFIMRTRREATSGEIASVFGELAFRLGYLKTERVLEEADYARMSTLLRRECERCDWTLTEVTKQFGTPSWSSSSGNPYYPCTTLYLFHGTPFRSIAFDFWNELDLRPEREKLTGIYGEIPVLRDVRIRGKSFPSDFIFTPIGKHIIQKGAQ